MKVTLEYDPALDKYETILDALIASYGLGEEGGENTATTAVANGAPAGWTIHKMRRYCQALTESGQEILAYIAQNAPSAPVDDVIEMTGMGPSVFAGAMSTFGHAINAVRGVNDRPFAKNNAKRTYTINEAVADLAVQALTELEVIP